MRETSVQHHSFCSLCCRLKTHSLTRAVHKGVESQRSVLWQPDTTQNLWFLVWRGQSVALLRLLWHYCVCVWGCLSVEIPMKGTSKVSSCSQVCENITSDVVCVLSKSLSESITRSTLQIVHYVALDKVEASQIQFYCCFLTNVNLTWRCKASKKTKPNCAANQWNSRKWSETQLSPPVLLISCFCFKGITMRSLNWNVSDIGPSKSC